MIGKSNDGILARDFVRAMKLQGIADDDILSIMEKAGMSNEMALSMLNRVTEEVDIEGIKDTRSIVREEVESAVWSTNRELIDEMRQLASKVESLSLEWENMSDAMREETRELISSVESFKEYAKEIMRILRK
jgi:D-ribose pyranose/furanose isomerase RbsD